MKLFIDTETTGKADFYAEPSAKHQPRVVQLAALLTDDKGGEAASFCFIIRPDGFEIPPDVSKIHGITQEFAAANGIAGGMAMEMLRELAVKADTYVAHNIGFDALMLAVEADRMVCDLKGPLDRKRWFCTMAATTPICKLPGNYGKYKWPKLIEAHQFAFGTGFEGAHDALADVRACKRIYFWLKEREKPGSEPKV
jgi:DNA polymerase III subunit epsilon